MLAPGLRPAVTVGAQCQCRAIDADGKSATWPSRRSSSCAAGRPPDIVSPWGERVDALGVRDRPGAQDGEMATGHQVQLGAWDEAGELAALGDGHEAVAPTVQHECRDAHVRKAPPDVVAVAGFELAADSAPAVALGDGGNSGQQPRAPPASDLRDGRRSASGSAPAAGARGITR
jgi:hypothetical protein